MRRPDPALAALLACIALLGLASALSVPAGLTESQAYDEGAHLAYVQSLAERGRAPAEDRAGRYPDSISTEQRVAERASGSALYPLWTEAAERRWRSAEAELGPDARGDGGGPNDVGYMPPGYYAALVAPYELAGGAWFDRALALRLTSTLLVALAAALAWRLALAVGLPRAGALAAAGVVGLNPHAIQLAGAVNPDAAVLALWTGVLLVGVRLLVDGSSLPRLALLGVLVAALLAVKPIGLAILPAVALVVILALRRSANPRAGMALGAAGLVGAAALTLLVTRRLERPLVSGDESLGEAPGYLVQFYTPLVAPLEDAPSWILAQTVALGDSRAASLALAVVCLLAAAGAVLVFRDRARVSWAVVAFLALAVAGLLAGVHWMELRALTEGRGAFAQPRYLLPAAPVLALLVAAALMRVPERWRGPAIAAVLALCAGGSIAWVLERAEMAYA